MDEENQKEIERVDILEKSDDEIMHKFSKRFKEIRKKRGITQKEVAKEMGVSRALIASWENGSRYPRQEYWLMLTNYLGVSFGYLTGYIDKPDHGRAELLSKEEMEILNDDGKKALRLYYEFLSGTLEYTLK